MGVTGAFCTANIEWVPVRSHRSEVPFRAGGRGVSARDYVRLRVRSGCDEFGVLALCCLLRDAEHGADLGPGTVGGTG